MPADPLSKVLVEIALEAGRLVLGMRGQGRVVTKDDGSPQTGADRAADALITARLRAFAPGVPVVSEEAAACIAGVADRFFLVDPIDGTREFLAGRDEFTINIALVVAGRPEGGVVLAPALGEIFLASSGSAFAGVLAANLSGPGRFVPIRVSGPETPIRAVASRSHLDERTAGLLGRLPVTARLHFGSALKFCRVAQGRAELYPRLGPTMEWDNAAGEAVLVAAGGAVLGLAGDPPAYGKAAEGYRAGPFVAAASLELARRAVAASR